MQRLRSDFPIQFPPFQHHEFPEYLQLSQLLSAQQPVTNHPDEFRFIAINHLIEIQLCLIKEEMIWLTHFDDQERTALVWQTFLNRQIHYWQWLLETLDLLSISISSSNLAQLFEYCNVQVDNQRVQLAEIRLMWNGIDQADQCQGIELSHFQELLETFQEDHVWNLFRHSSPVIQSQEELTLLMKKVHGLIYDQFDYATRQFFKD